MSAPDAAAPGSGEPRAAASDRLLAQVLREESARIVAALTAWLGSFDLAEESVAEAIEEARAGVAGARRAAESRRHGSRRRPGTTPSTGCGARSGTARSSRCSPSPTRHGPRRIADEPDERLALLFGCCHPALSPESQLALTLRVICGLTTAQIARATLSAETAVAQRIVRAKRKIGAAGIPLRIPEPAERPERLDIVLTVDLGDVQRGASRRRARRERRPRPRGRRRVAGPGGRCRAAREAEAHGLLALLLFHRAREDARAVDGELVLLGDQDRSRWDRGCWPTARRELEAAAMLRRPGRWQLHAAIAACHADARSSDETDWLQVLTLYDMLLAYDRSPIVRLNRAVALAEIEGPDAALDRGRRPSGRARRIPPVARRAGQRAAASSAATTRHSPRICGRSSSPRTRPSAGSSSPAGALARYAPTGVSACETSRSRVVIPSCDRIDSR